MRTERRRSQRRFKSYPDGYRLEEVGPEALVGKGCPFTALMGRIKG